MSLVGQLVKDVEDAGLGQERRVFVEAKLLRDFVCSDEAYAENIVGQPVRILLNHGNGFVFILLVDFRSVSGADPMGLKKQHDGADFFLLFPRLTDHADALRADTWNFHKLLDVGLDDVEGGLPEQLDDALGHDRADALDEARSEVLFDAVNRGRGSRLVI